MKLIFVLLIISTSIISAQSQEAYNYNDYIANLEKSKVESIRLRAQKLNFDYHALNTSIYFDQGSPKIKGDGVLKNAYSNLKTVNYLTIPAGLDLSEVKILILTVERPTDLVKITSDLKLLFPNLEHVVISSRVILSLENFRQLIPAIKNDLVYLLRNDTPS